MVDNFILEKPLKVLITNAATKTVFSFLPMLCNGDVFGKHQKLHLVLFAFKPLIEEVETLANDLLECCFLPLEKIETTMDMSRAFCDVDVAILFELERNVIGFKTNAVLFRSYGLILNRQNNKNVKVLVCGRTANTSAFVCSSFTPSINPNNFTCLVEHIRHHLKTAVKTHHSPPKINPDTDVGKNEDFFVWGSCSNPLLSGQRGDGSHSCLRDVKLGLRSPGALVTAKAISEHLQFWLVHNRPCTSSDGAKKSFNMGIYTNGNNLGLHENLYFNLPVGPGLDQKKFPQTQQIDSNLLQALSESSEQLSKERESAIVDCWRVVLPLSHM